MVAEPGGPAPARKWSSRREFLAPLPLCAVGLLAVNDHFLKTRFHNALTGKLSDLALCFFMPLFLSASLAAVPRLSQRARLLAGAFATALVFATLKISPAADRIYCRGLDAVWSGIGLRFQAVADPTDLFCLPLIGVALLYGAHRHRGNDA